MPTRDDAGGGSVATTSLRTARNAAALMVAELLGKLFTFAYTVVAARELAPTEFGHFAYALALSLLVAVVPKWGFSTDVIRRGSRERDRLDSLLGASLVWTVGGGVVVMGLTGLVAGSTRGDPDAVAVLWLLLAATLLDSATERLRAGAAAVERQQGVSVALVANRLVTGVAIIALLVSGAGVVGMGIGYLAGSVLDLLLTTWLLVRMGVRPRPTLRGHDLAATWRGSWVLGISSVAAMMLFRVDQVIVDALLGAASLAAYAVAYRLVETVLFLSWSLARAVLPVMAAATEAWQLRRSLARGVAALSVVYVPFALVALVEPAASLDAVFGAGYVAEATPVLRWLAPSPLLFGIAYLAGQVLVAQDRDVVALVANVVATVLNVGLNLWLVPVHGIAAAAAVTSVTLGIRAVIAIGGARLGRGGRVVLGATTRAAAAGVVLAVVLVGLEAWIGVELVVGGVVYALTWFALTRRWAPDDLSLLGSVVPLRRHRPARG